MDRITIDRSRCKKDGLCARVCPKGIFVQREKLAIPELVDEEALIVALDLGKVQGAWFDAFWEEPYRGKLLGFKQVLMTPHVSTYTRQCRCSMEMSAVENLLRDLGVAENI